MLIVSTVRRRKRNFYASHLRYIYYLHRTKAGVSMLALVLLACRQAIMSSALLDFAENVVAGQSRPLCVCRALLNPSYDVMLC